MNYLKNLMFQLKPRIHFFLGALTFISYCKSYDSLVVPFGIFLLLSLFSVSTRNSPLSLFFSFICPNWLKMSIAKRLREVSNWLNPK